jgi:putative redox protein
MKASVTYVTGGPFIGKADSGHATVLDWSGGTNSAPSPVEMLLLSLGACSAIDVVSILEKARTPAESFRVELSGERAEAHPRVFTKIHLTYVVKGKGIKPAALERAIHLSEEKYCSISAMIRDVAKIKSTYRIEE